MAKLKSSTIKEDGASSNDMLKSFLTNKMLGLGNSSMLTPAEMSSSTEQTSDEEVVDKKKPAATKKSAAEILHKNKQLNSSSSAEQTSDEDIDDKKLNADKIKGAQTKKSKQVQPLSNSTFNKQLLQAASLTSSRDYLKHIINSNAIHKPLQNQTVPKLKGILKNKVKKKEKLSDSESDRDSNEAHSNTLVASVQIASENNTKHEDRDDISCNSDDDFMDNPLATSTQKNDFVEERYHQKEEEKQNDSFGKSKSNKIRIIENNVIMPPNNESLESERQDEDEDEMETNKKLTDLLTHVYQDEELKPVTRKHIMKINLDDAEVFLVHMPKTLDPKLFVGCTISPEQKTKIRVQNEKFILKTSFERQDPLSTIAKLKGGSYGCKTVKPIGRIFVQQHVVLKDKTEPPKVATDIVEFPGELKIRHPLFGDDFSGKIELDEVTQQKLDDVISKHCRKKKDKKKKSKKERQLSAAEVADEVVFKMLNESVLGDRERRKVDKKIKTPNRIMHSTMMNSLESTPVFDPNEIDESKIGKHKKKKHKMEPRKVLLEEFANIDDECESEKKATKKRKHKHDDVSGDDVSGGERKRKRYSKFDYDDDFDSS